MTLTLGETQLANLRIGHRCAGVDMYGGRHEFEGRITGFTMGRATLALPPQNATGNFVKIVQRLPVRMS
jgi:membrane fusion protein (multidrug efflux system)